MLPGIATIFRIGVAGPLGLAFLSAPATILFETPEDWETSLGTVKATRGAIAPMNRAASPSAILAAASLKDASAESCHDASVLLFDRKEFEAAESMARRAVAADPRFAPGHYMLGTTLLAMGQDQASREALLEALRIEPDYPEALSNLGVAHFRLGETRIALLSFIMALELKVAYPDAWANYLTVLSRELVPSDANPLPEPRDEGETAPAVWHWRAAVEAMNAGQADLSLRHFLRSLSLDLNNPNTHNDIAVLLDRIGRKALALPFLRAASVLAPDSELVSENLEKLDGEVSRQFLETQVAVVKRKLSRGDNATDRVKLAEVYRQMDQKNDVVEQLRRAVELEPEVIEYHVRLAQSLSTIDQHGEALLALQPALKMDPGNPRWRYRAAWLLLRIPDSGPPNHQLAVRFAREACEMTEYQRKDCLELLAKALDLAGDRKRAEAFREKARELE